MIIAADLGVGICGWATCRFSGGGRGCALRSTSLPCTGSKAGGPGPSGLALASPAPDEAAFGALLAEPFGSVAPQDGQQVVVLGPRGEVHRPPRRVPGVARRIDVRAGFDLSELNIQDRNQCTRSTSFGKIAIVSKIAINVRTRSTFFGKSEIV